MSSRKELADYLMEHSISRGDFTLASGIKSDSYIDMMRCAGNPTGRFLLGNAVAARVRDLQFTAVGGPEVKALPIALETIHALELYGRTLKFFFTRKQPKDHGTMRLVEGTVAIGDQCVLVEDVATSGLAVLNAMEALYRSKISILAVVPVVDRSDGRIEAAVKEKAKDRAKALAMESISVIEKVSYLPVLFAADLGLKEVSYTA